MVHRRVAAGCRVTAWSSVPLREHPAARRPAPSLAACL